RFNFQRHKDVMIFNGLIGLGTVVGQTAYNILAFHCLCSPKKNYLYGLTAIGVPALAFFVIRVMLNQNTWDIASEYRTKRCRKLSLTAAFALLGSVVGRAVVAPVTWTVISLLRGEAYVCAFSEFINPSSLDGFISSIPGPEIMARFPCKDVPKTARESRVSFPEWSGTASQGFTCTERLMTLPSTAA
uniref:Calcium homeostasis modulator family member 2, tandem duplicate 2 n=1 Tax=Sinocyclocheilus anshuiensis TaxID=1608454 RepID=A0A671NK52_9TELE